MAGISCTKNSKVYHKNHLKYDYLFNYKELPVYRCNQLAGLRSSEGCNQAGVPLGMDQTRIEDRGISKLLIYMLLFYSD